MDKKTDVEVYFEMRRETPGAYLFSDGVSEFWLPKSQVEIEHVKGIDYRVWVPEWLAEEKEII